MIVLIRKLRHKATSSLKEGEPNFVSKIVKIAYQQIFGLLLSNYYCLDIELLLSEL